MIPENVWSLVPKELPRDLPSWVNVFAHAAELSERESRAYAWAMYLLNELSPRQVSAAIGGIASARGASIRIVDISAGFISFDPSEAGKVQSLRSSRIALGAPTTEGERLGYSFGLVIGLASPDSLEARERDFSDSISQTTSTANFPIIVEYRDIAFHTPPRPMGAASACFASPRASKRYFGPVWSNGIVIARHSLANLGFATGISVPMYSGGSSPVVDIDSGTVIDAAILDGGRMPHGTAPLPLATAVAPGSSVEIQCPSGNLSASVLRVNDHPKYFGHLIAHRLFLSAAGAAGDSGSLIRRTPHADAAGIYMGTTGGSTPEGIAQSMRQVVEYFDIDIHY